MVKRSKGGGISLPPLVSETQSDSLDLPILHREVIFFSFHLGACLLVAVLQTDALGVGEQPIASLLCCTEWLWSSS